MFSIKQAQSNGQIIINIILVYDESQEIDFLSLLYLFINLQYRNTRQ